MKNSFGSFKKKGVPDCLLQNAERIRVILDGYGITVRSISEAAADLLWNIFLVQAHSKRSLEKMDEYVLKAFTYLHFQQSFETGHLLDQIAQNEEKNNESILEEIKYDGIIYGVDEILAEHAVLPAGPIGLAFLAYLDWNKPKIAATFDKGDHGVGTFKDDLVEALVSISSTLYLHLELFPRQEKLYKFKLPILQMTKDLAKRVVKQEKKWMPWLEPEDLVKKQLKILIKRDIKIPYYILMEGKLDIPNYSYKRLTAKRYSSFLYPVLMIARSISTLGGIYGWGSYANIMQLYAEKKPYQKIFRDEIAEIVLASMIGAKLGYEENLKN